MMFKKGDVVEFCFNDDTKFTVVVTTDEDEQIFAGVVTETDGKAWKSGFYNDRWSTCAFKHKQEVATPHEAFPVLKDGMVIETRCRGFYLVCAGKVMRHDGYNRVTSYEKNGKHKGNNSNFDIVRVYSGEHLYNFDLYEYVSDYPQDLVWNGKKNVDKIASLRSQVDSLQEQIKQLEEEDNV